MNVTFKLVLISAGLFGSAVAYCYLMRKSVNQWLSWVPTLFLLGLSVNFLPPVWWAFLTALFLLPTVLAIAVFESEKSIRSAIIAFFAALFFVSILVQVSDSIWTNFVSLIRYLDDMKKWANN
jgi:predicted PurR-regulated permease PerM